MHTKVVIFDYYNNFFYYKVIVTYRSISRRITYKYDINTMSFIISAPFYCSKTEILKGLDLYADKLIDNALKAKRPIEDDQIYIYGNLIPLIESDKNEIDENAFYLTDKKNIYPIMKKYFLKYLTEKVMYYKSIMGIIRDYKIKINKGTSTYASNSRTANALNFSIRLMHYKKNAIDSVIIHELAHDVHFDHSKNFYNLVYKFCPMYDHYCKILDNHEYDKE